MVQCDVMIQCMRQRPICPHAVHSCFPTAGDISGAVQTLRSLLLFYPTDAASLDNLQLYHETLGGDTEPPGTQPAQVLLNVRYIKITMKVIIMIHGPWFILLIHKYIQLEVSKLNWEQTIISTMWLKTPSSPQFCQSLSQSIKLMWGVTVYSSQTWKFVCICRTGDCQIRKSLSAGEEAALFRYGEPWLHFYRPSKFWCQTKRF